MTSNELDAANFAIEHDNLIVSEQDSLKLQQVGLPRKKIIDCSSLRQHTNADYGLAMEMLKRWLCTWDALGAARTNELEQIYHSLILRYQEPHRRYHTVQHLLDCLDRVVDLQSIAEHFAELELALWFHDAI